MDLHGSSFFVQVFEAVGDTFNITWLQGWLTDQKTGFIGLLIVVTWQLSGYMMMIYIAQIQNIPDSVLEAAQIDGATGWKKAEVNHFSVDDAGLYNRVIPFHFEFI